MAFEKTRYFFNQLAAV